MGDQMAAYDDGDRRADEETTAERNAARDRRRRDLESHLQEQDNASASEGVPQSNSPANLMRSRRRALRPSERLPRHQRERLAQTGRNSAAETYVSPSSLSPTWPDQTSDDRGDRQRAKRRKLDDGTYEEDPRTFSYGNNGQVVPGQLRLDIISCDGGEYSDPHTPINSYPQNVLNDDNSVYCTKSNRCNLLLKHVGGMPFTLTEMVVKAPRSGYDAPIQEGLVFIAMEDENLLHRTSQYDVRWAPKTSRHERRRRDTYRPSHEYMNSTRSPLRSIDRSRYLHNPVGFEDDPFLEAPLVQGFRVTVADPSDDEEAGHGPLSPRLWHDDDYSLRSYVDRYRPVYLEDERHSGLLSNSSDSEGYEPDTRPEERDGSRERERFQRRQLDLENTLAHRNRMLDLMRAQQIRESDEFFGRRDRDRDLDDERRHTLALAASRSTRRTFAPAYGAPDPNPVVGDRSHRSITLENPTSKTVSNTAEASTSTPGTEIVRPHARFFISRSKSSTAIKFDPPV